jgi:hypothetical protein
VPMGEFRSPRVPHGALRSNEPAAGRGSHTPKDFCVGSRVQSRGARPGAQLPSAFSYDGRK